ncbi:MAG: STAS domain-containing protein [Thermoanaerobaculales bacterium]|jgi:anti-sigma B factor antagonist|nr:STAS domain-containing protein [Thermoanaerobaculales bacterium]
MKISKREVGDVTVLELKGKVMIGSGDVQLRDAIDETVNNGAAKILVDLGGVSKMDSSGLGELVSAHNTVTEKGGRIALANLPSKLYDVLGATRIISVIDVFDDVDEGVASFRR